MNTLHASCNLKKLNATELKKLNGGLIMYPGQGILELALKTIAGAYEEGYDNGKNNCECN